MSYMDYNLISCPFCAADVKEGRENWLSYDQHHYFSVACSCGAFGPKKDSKEKAVMAWNTREDSVNDLLWNPFDFQKKPDTVDIKGKLQSISSSCILQMLSVENKTGILQLSHGRKTSALCLKDGQVIAASSNSGPQLGQLLFDRGFISLEKLQKVLDKSKSSGRRLGETLLDMGYISQEILRSVIREQVSQAIQGLILWQEGIFQYRDCPIEFDERGVETINIMGIMLDALRISDELTDDQVPDQALHQGIKIV